MFNLIPENTRKALTTEYRLRHIIIATIFLIFIQMSFLVFLLPTWLTSFYKEKEVSGKTEEIDIVLSNLDVSSTTAYIKSLNSKLLMLDDTLEYPKFVPILDDLLSKNTSAIRISGINYTVDTKNTGKIFLTGVGGTRESLVSFTDKLREITFFKKVDLPISNLAKDRDIAFTININIEK